VVRNDYRPARDIQTGIGPVNENVPKIRSRGGQPVSFCSALVLLASQTKGLSASTVSRLKQTWRQEYESWRQRRSNNDRWVYMCGWMASTVA